MNQTDAQQEAQRRWGDIGRLLLPMIHAPYHCVGFWNGYATVVCGKGNSWEAAFADADKKKEAK